MGLLLQEEEEEGEEEEAMKIAGPHSRDSFINANFPARNLQRTMKVLSVGEENSAAAVLQRVLRRAIRWGFSSGIICVRT